MSASGAGQPAARARLPESFLAAYPGASFEVIAGELPGVSGHVIAGVPSTDSDVNLPPKWLPVSGGE